MLRDGRFLGRSTRRFALQWHITDACDLRCKHCYDRSRRSPMSLDQAQRVIDELGRFCRERGVQGHVTLTGGNPLLHPRFFEIYRRVAGAGFGLSILGNPIDAVQLKQMVGIARPRYYQVSLEGLEAHNDSIRQPGHYQRVMGFLADLQSHGICAHVMLTLTRANVDEVLPLAGALRGRANRFTFNRLAQTGEGATLELPTREAYARFLGRYAEAARTNPMLGTKDNLLNIRRHAHRAPLHGGCTGVGCGAAFNFIALLADGEAHACRKLPSPLGNLLDSGLAAIYDGKAAQRYRDGCSACAGCPIRNACGGCLAVSYGQGREIFKEVDPHCFMSPQAHRSLTSRIGDHLRRGLAAARGGQTARGEGTGQPPSSIAPSS